MKSLVAADEQTKAEKFSASNGWLYRMKKRNNLTLRMPTHKSQQNTQTNDERFIDAAFYISNLNKAARKFPNTRLYNMDECPYWMDHLHKRTIDQVGAKSVDVANTGHEKTRFTVVKTISASGKMLPLFIIFPSKKFYTKII